MGWETWFRGEGGGFGWEEGGEVLHEKQGPDGVYGEGLGDVGVVQLRG